MLRRTGSASILRPALRDFGGQVAHSKNHNKEDSFEAHLPARSPALRDEGREVAEPFDRAHGPEFTEWEGVINGLKIELT